MDLFKQRSSVGGSFLFLASIVATVSASKIFRQHSSTSRKAAPAAIAAATGDQSRPSYWAQKDGEHSFLEAVESDEALGWVKGRNQHAVGALGRPEDNPLYKRILAILNSKDKIPHVRKIGDFYYNFWQDENNKRGLLRRTTLMNYKSPDPRWQTVLDIDDLGKAEKESWVYKGYTLFKPDNEYEPATRILLELSRGGADATVIREFDLQKLQFVPESETPFYLPEAKSRVSWKSKDVLLVGTDLKDGDSLTESGYPRVVREWVRGTPLQTARTVYEGEKSDVSVGGYVTKHRSYKIEMRYRSLTFYTSVKYVKLPITNNSSKLINNTAAADLRDADGFQQIPVPADAEVGTFADQLLIELRSDWVLQEESANGAGDAVVVKAGSLLAVGLEEFMEKNVKASFTTLFTPTDRISLSYHTKTRNFLIIDTLDNVKSRLVFWKYDENKQQGGGAKLANEQQDVTQLFKDAFKKDVKGSAAAGESTGSTPPVVASTTSSSSKWTCVGAEQDAVIRGSSVVAVDPDENDFYWFTTSSFTKPSTLSLANANLGPQGVAAAKPLKSLPPQYDATGLVETQLEATSRDGTKIPYFIVGKEEMKLDGSNPTLLYGYGGFEISLTPAYAALVGSGWLEKGGFYVTANIRGGGEFGPTWHQAALKANRQLAYDDFIAVAEDLIARKVTTADRLGIRGGSNGGLLMGNMIVQRPDLFGAVCCAVPLLDMKRFHKLLAGNSWMAEYGDPDTDDWQLFLQNYSPYHNIATTSTEVAAYPPLLMTTSTRDDRVHPYHARCFVKRLLDMQAEGVTVHDKTTSQSFSRGSVYYYENIEGGHGGAADNNQQAFMNTLYLDFLWKTIGKK